MSKPQPVTTPPTATITPRWLIPALLGLTFLFLAGLFSTEISDPDFWWHLKTGQYIVTQHRLPVPDPFSFTTARAPLAPGEATTQRFNLTHEWLAQAVWYLIYAVGGFPAVVLWKALLLAALCALTGAVAAQRTNSRLWGVAAALAASSLAIEFARDRPSILSYLFTAAFLYICENRRRLWLLPALSVVWANSHGGFFLGWIVCGAYCAEALLRRAPDARRLLWISGLTVVLSGLNPNGFAALATVLRYRQSPLQSMLIEWRGAFDAGVQSPVAFHILFFGVAFVLLLAWKRVRPADWLLFSAFAIAALTAFRNEMLIGLLAPILIATYFPWKRSLPTLATYGAAAALAAGLVWGVASGSFFKLRAAEWRYPAGAVSFLASHHIDTPLFNTYEYGGYLIWKGRSVYIDGRALNESVFADYRRILAAPYTDLSRYELLSKYGVGAILVNAFEYNTGALYPLVPAMTGSDWKLVYEDPQALLFLHQPPPDMEVLDPNRILDHLDSECRLHIEHEPDLSLCARTTSDYFLRANDKDRARRALKLYLEHPYPGDTEASRAYLKLIDK